MKTRSKPSAAANQLICRYGRARFYQKPVGRAHWTDENVPMFKPNWLVRFHVGGQTWDESAGPMYPVQDGLSAVKVWAETVMRTKLEALRSGRLDAMEAVVRPAKVVMLSELLKVYLQNTPPDKPDYAKNAARLRMIMEEVSGLEATDIQVSDRWFSSERLRQWVRMRQKHFRNGWTKRGEAPVDAWDQLRMLQTAGRLPGIDKSKVMECNTTIKSYLRCAKAIFANSREYLPGVVLPELREFLTFSVDVEAPEGHREIAPEVMKKLSKALARLRVEDPKVWVFNQLEQWTGARPITLRRLGRDALTVAADGSGMLALPTTKGGKPVLWPLPEEVVSVVLEVATEASLIGADAEGTYRAHNDWLSGLGVVGTQKSYLFRHARLQQLRDHGGVEMAAAGGGHTTTAMVQRKYTEALKAMPMLDPREARQTA